MQQIVEANMLKSYIAMLHHVPSPSKSYAWNYQQEFHVAHCTEVSDDSLEAILMLCSQIYILIFHGCPLVTERLRYAMDEVAERGGRLKQVSWTIY